MATTFSEETVAIMKVYHKGQIVFERYVDFNGPVEELRAAREEGRKLAEYLKANPDSPAPLPEGWGWRAM